MLDPYLQQYFFVVLVFNELCKVKDQLVDYEGRGKWVRAVNMGHISMKRLQMYVESYILNSKLQCIVIFDNRFRSELSPDYQREHILANVDT